jgi:predicted DNA-binding protein (UPF0251 family)
MKLNPSREAARLVLIDGLGATAASRAVGIHRSAVNQSVRRIKSMLAKVDELASLNP